MIIMTSSNYDLRRPQQECLYCRRLFDLNLKYCLHCGKPVPGGEIQTYDLERNEWRTFST